MAQVVLCTSHVCHCGAIVVGKGLGYWHAPDRGWLFGHRLMLALVMMLLVFVFACVFVCLCAAVASLPTAVRQTCPACSLKVYPMDKQVAVEGHLYHQTCFKVLQVARCFVHSSAPAGAGTTT